MDIEHLIKVKTCDDAILARDQWVIESFQHQHARINGLLRTVRINNITRKEQMLWKIANTSTSRDFHKHEH
jgi:hypothetical protein